MMSVVTVYLHEHVCMILYVLWGGALCVSGSWIMQFIHILMHLSVGPGWGSALLIPNRAPRHPPRLGGVTLYYNYNIILLK